MRSLVRRSLAELSICIGDARALKFNPASMGEGSPDAESTGHDWQYLLMKTHLLLRDAAVAQGCRAVATRVVIAGVLLAVRLFHPTAMRLPGPLPLSPPRH